jgi:hypothetical protein
MKWILHDWDDADAARIVRNVRAAIPSDGRLIVFDRLLPERIPSGDVAVQLDTLIDLNMLVNVNAGRERSEAEFRTLLAAGGFRAIEVAIPAQLMWAIRREGSSAEPAPARPLAEHASVECSGRWLFWWQ